MSRAEFNDAQIFQAGVLLGAFKRIVAEHRLPPADKFAVTLLAAAAQAHMAGVSEEAATEDFRAALEHMRRP